MKKIIVLLLTLIFTSCMHIKEDYKSTHRAYVKEWSGLNRRETVKLRFIENKNGRNKFKLTSIYIPGLEIEGVVTQKENDYILKVFQARLFSNWEHGWTEGFYEASGEYKLIPKDEKRYSIVKIEDFKLWSIKRGEIRYRDRYYREDDGTWRVKNRVDRLLELSSVTEQEFKFEKFYNKMNFGKKSFQSEVYPALFPEFYNFKKLKKTGKLHSSYYTRALALEVVKGDQISWRSDYTKSVFPEYMWELRDTGTLYRDAIEAPKLFYSLYNKDTFFNGALLNCVLIKD